MFDLQSASNIRGIFFTRVIDENERKWAKIKQHKSFFGNIEP